MNVFIRELRANRKALIIWSICMFLFVLSGMGKYTAYSSGANNEVFDKMPHTMKALLGFGSFDVTTMSGFFAFLFPYLALTAAIHAALLGSGIISKEERDKTAEFLMAKPISRAAIVTSKLFAALINIIVINLVTLLSSIAMVAAYNKGKDISGEVLVFLLSMFIIQLIFLSLGVFISAVMRKPKAAGSLTTGILFSSYVISKITDLTDSLNALNVLSPFKYFSYENIVKGNGLSTGVTILSILLVAVLLASAYSFYAKRDLSV
ncbi:ABC transporter permease subunit [Clostridium sp. YIM B02515]|uniref:ABC transporter permease subunit n=1 Tax=Clostridium rhizosphaerae TaxID=2803861 RepID=A0ABS1T509_9CLOT|nr:ABC transporter permease subunit [Clostridium rhizosphaerae]MBL4934410.1 ABC transporter permease subunit [Clostridium rhizosphaerae]